MAQTTVSTKVFAKIHCLIDLQLELLTKKVTVHLDSGTGVVESLELGVVGPSIGAQKTTASFSSSVPRDGFEFVVGPAFSNGEFHQFQFVAGTSQLAGSAWIKSMAVSQSTNDAITADFEIQFVGKPVWTSLNP